MHVNDCRVASLPDGSPASEVRLGEIVRALGGELQGDPDLRIVRIASLESAEADSISYLAQAKLRHRLQSTRAGAVVLTRALADAAPLQCCRIIVDSPYLYFARMTQWWASRVRPQEVSGIHPSAVIEEGAQIHPSAYIGPHAYVGAGACIGAHARLFSHAHIGAGSRIGVGSLLHPRVTVAYGCVLGSRNVVLSGAVIGGDGFGNAQDGEGRWIRIEQLGSMVTGDGCDIGANTCIDRGALDDTVLGDGVKLDNLIQIAHNCTIGDHTAMAACVGVAGSAKIGRHCMIGGAAMINGHIEICDRVFVSGGTFVGSSIRKPGRYTGVFLGDEHSSWEKNAATLRQLHRLRDRVRAIEQRG